MICFRPSQASPSEAFVPVNGMTLPLWLLARAEQGPREKALPP